MKYIVNPTDFTVSVIILRHGIETSLQALPKCKIELNDYDTFIADSKKRWPNLEFKDTEKTSGIELIPRPTISASDDSLENYDEEEEKSSSKNFRKHKRGKR